MSVLEINIPKTNWTLLEWRKYSNEKPKNNDRCLIVIGKDVVAARFLNGAFFANNWSRAENVMFWSPWPQAPNS